jgi:hypothetical protein
MCQFLKGADVNFPQFLDGGTISVFSHKRDIIYDTKWTTDGKKNKVVKLQGQKGI